MKKLTASLSAALVAAGCGGGPKTVSNEVSWVPARSDETIAEWSVATEHDHVTIAVVIGPQRVALGTYVGHVYPAWQSYCDAKLGVSPARNVDEAKRRNALAKLTVTGEVADPNDPVPPGSTTFWLKRPTPGHIDVWKQDAIVASVSVWADTRFVETIEDDDDRPGFACGGDDGMNQ